MVFLPLVSAFQSPSLADFLSLQHGSQGSTWAFTSHCILFPFRDSVIELEGDQVHISNPHLSSELEAHFYWTFPPGFPTGILTSNIFLNQILCLHLTHSESCDVLLSSPTISNLTCSVYLFYLFFSFHSYCYSLSLCPYHFCLVFTYLAPGLSCGTQDTQSSLQQDRSLVVTCELLVEACEIQFFVVISH